MGTVRRAILLAGILGCHGVSPAGGAALPGTIDPTFQPGEGLTAPSSGGHLTHFLIQPDGRILITGAFAQVDGINRGYVARLQANGAFDPSFDARITGAIGIDAIARQPDGKILLGGDFVYVDGFARPELARVFPDGAKDTTFATNLSLFPRVYAIAVQPNGCILIAGSFGAVAGRGRNVARLQANGDPDPSFEAVVGPPEATVTDLQLLPEGRILIAGSFTVVNGVPRAGIARLLADGKTDPDFRPGSGANHMVFRMLRQPDDRLVVGGFFTMFDGESRSGLARLEPDGGLDPGFRPQLEPVGAPVYALARQADGKLLIGGAFAMVDGLARESCARLLPDGQLDTGFVVEEWWPGSITALAVQPDGRILLGGYSTPGALKSSGGYLRVVGGPYALQCTAINLTSPHGIELTWVGDPGTRFALETTPNLKAWQAVGTNQLSQVVGIVVDPEGGLGPARFYRGLILPPP